MGWGPQGIREQPSEPEGAPAPPVDDCTALRLAAEGAARIVNDATALGTAVNRLIAPDQAATMAQAGWDVISRGAAVTDKVIDLVQETLDQREATS